MYFKLSEALINRFVFELRKYWVLHPQYPDIARNIQDKHSFEERPQYGMVVKAGGTSGVHFSPDNYVGLIHSYACQKQVGNYLGASVEWIREDPVAIQKNNGVFPSSPGIYYLDFVGPDSFYIDILYTVEKELLSVVTDNLGNSTAVISSGNFHKDSLRITESPSGLLWYENSEYTANPATGEITLLRSLSPDSSLWVDYRYPKPNTGPFEAHENRANNQAIPGVTLFFGTRRQDGDKLAIEITKSRTAVAEEYGGRWRVSLEVEIFSRDKVVCRRMVDQSLVYLWGIARSYLVNEGIMVQDISAGGESEEIYDDVGELYYYNSSLSIDVEVEWAIHVPLGATMKQFLPMSAEEAKLLSSMTDEEILQHVQQTGIRSATGFELHNLRDPYLLGRSSNYELIH